MKRAESRPAQGEQADERLTSYMLAILENVAQLLVHCGLSPARLRSAFVEICDALDEPREALKAPDPEYVADLPHVLTRWRMDRRFIDDHGEPRALPLEGELSLSELVTSVLPKYPVETVVDALVRTGTVRRRGEMYRPVESFVLFGGIRRDARVFTLMSLLAFLRTWKHNLVQPTRRTKLVARTAINAAVPIRLLPKLRKRLSRVAKDFLESHDAYMTVNQVPPGSEPTVRAGVGVYSIEDPIVVDEEQSTGRSSGRGNAER